MGSNPTPSANLTAYYAYILKSLATGEFYKGSCENLQRRIGDHNRGKVRSTKSKRPWVIHYSEEFETRLEALERERFFKSRSGWRWLEQAGFCEYRFCLSTIFHVFRLHDRIPGRANVDSIDCRSCIKHGK